MLNLPTDCVVFATLNRSFAVNATISLGLLFDVSWYGSGGVQKMAF